MTGHKSGKYKETKIYTTTAGAEAVSAVLLGLGVNGVAISDRADIEAVLAHGDETVWAFPELSLPVNRERPDEVIVTYYTTDDEEGDALIARVRTELMKLKAGEQYGDYGADADFGRLYAETEEVGDEWKTKWKDYFKPFRMTDRFVICPPWEAAGDAGNENPGAEIIVIDPGMAFGTGTHETTAMCGETLEKVIDASSMVLDIGTGSGILAIIAAKCGARSVIAIDIDDDALRSASENVKRNDVEQTIELIKGNITVPEVCELLVPPNGEGRFGVICANLTSGILKRILPYIADLLAKDGKLILSGILETERGDMLSAIADCGMKVSLEKTRGEWLMLCVDS
ncbi:MAG: 50S ribosomal protein L11 methyltransferase [Clostridiales Family XIII bacterium]|jgi:ribosomal protein L11 methyltransferase|nr:50S ribosomal protein L11 methyltransferase [Clostridiales Family XIII bacterium]